jgi:hypothetical protein
MTTKRTGNIALMTSNPSWKKVLMIILVLLTQPGFSIVKVKMRIRAKRT